MGTPLKIIHQMTEAVMEGVQAHELGLAYQELCKSFPLIEITSQEQHRNALKVVERLIDYLNEPAAAEVAEDMQQYLAVLGDLVAKYEAAKFTNKRVPAKDVLAQLMQMNDLTQEDLRKELGGQSVVSLVLRGERELNVGQIRALAKRFKVSPEVFL